MLALRGLGDMAIVGDDEAREVGVVQDLLAGQWLWPRFNDELLPDKPTGYHWLTALSCAVFGFSETAVRLPSVLAAAGTIWWTVQFGSTLLGPRGGLAAGFVLATCRGFFAHARVARPHTLLVLLLALALGCAWRWWREATAARPRPRWHCSGSGSWRRVDIKSRHYGSGFSVFRSCGRDLRLRAGAPRRPARPHRGVAP